MTRRPHVGASIRGNAGLVRFGDGPSRTRPTPQHHWGSRALHLGSSFRVAQAPEEALKQGLVDSGPFGAGIAHRAHRGAEKMRPHWSRQVGQVVQLWDGLGLHRCRLRCGMFQSLGRFDGDRDPIEELRRELLSVDPFGQR